MSDPQQMLKRQAQWQKHRQSLTWSEKIRLEEDVQSRHAEKHGAQDKQRRREPSLPVGALGQEDARAKKPSHGQKRQHEQVRGGQQVLP